MDLIQFVSSRLGQNAQVEALQKLVFTILHHTIFGPDVLQFVVEHYLKSFSKTVWGDIFPYFRHSLDTSIYRDHQAIRPYRLRRSRLPVRYFEFICSQLDVSHLTLGRMHTLENEAAKQMYMSPILSSVLSLFSGRLINLPEQTLKGGITASGRCEFSVTLQEMVTVLRRKKFIQHDERRLKSPNQKAFMRLVIHRSFGMKPYTRATNSLHMLRLAHGHRVI